MPTVLQSALLGILLGSVPVAWVVVHLAARLDVSRQGSGNVGALNALRVARARWVGVLVMVLDGAKGALAVWLATWLDAEAGFAAQAAGGLGAVAGHNYNPWLSLAGRRLVGGKGFAAAAGALLMLCPWLVPAWLGTGVLGWFAFHRARGITDEAPASAVATVAIIPCAWLLYGGDAAWFALGLALLCLPKIVPELRVLLGRAGGPEGDASP